jgi:retron-type reverse transcriptase
VQKLTGNGYILESEYKDRLKGLALGNPLSPCVANLYLDSFDERVKALDVRLTRYADDFVILGKSPQEAEIRNTVLKRKILTKIMRLLYNNTGKNRK